MALTCRLGNFNKKINSTKRMPTNSGTLHNIICKDPISLQNPVLICTGTPLEHYNYMYFNNWWYYVDDVVSYTNNTFKVIAHVDPLATGKVDIMSTYGFCTFADKDHWNSLLDDSRLTTDLEDTTANKIIRMNTTDTVKWSQVGVIILRALAQTSIGATSVITYVLTTAQFSRLLTGLSSTLQSDFNGQSDVKEVLQNIAVKLLGAGNWSDNILSCVWVPFDVLNYTDLSDTSIVRIGAYEIAMSCKYSEDTIMIKSKNSSYTIPWTTNQNNYKFLRYPKYTSLTLCHPCGIVEINSPSLANQSTNDTIKVVYAVDLFSGDYYIIAKTGNVTQAGTPDLLSEVLGIGQGNVSMSVMNKVGEGFNLGGAILKAEASIAAQAVSLSMKPVVKAEETTTSIDISSTYDEYNGGSRLREGGGSTKVKTRKEYDTSGISGNYLPSFPKQASVNASCGGGVLPLYHVLTSFDDQFYIQMNASIPACILNYQYETMCDRYGYPCNQFLQLTNIDGYVECAGASCSSELPQNLVSTINSYLNSGIIIE